MTWFAIWVSYQTLLRKEMTRFLRIWSQTLLPPVITTALYFLIFGKLIGSQIQPVSGFTYMQFIVPGLVMMAVVTNSYINSSSSFFVSKFQRSIEEILMSPMPNAIILLGFVSGSVARALLVGILVVIIGLFFTHLDLSHLGLMLVTILLVSLFFGIAGVINGIFAKSFDDISWIPSFVLTPLTYLGGVFFSVNMLSGIWKTLAFFNPILYIVDIFRYAVLGMKSINITYGVSILFFADVVLFFYALHLMRTSSRLRS